MSTWNIGKICIENQIVAAPLAGISNPVYRKMCHDYGAGLVVSEMISDKALHYENKRTKDMCRTVEGEHPVSLQLFGGDPDTMAEASEYLTTHTDCDIIDINMGCPVTKVLKAHAGSYLMQDEDLAMRIAKAVVDHTNKPVTVKMRAGYDFNHINCVSLAKKLESVGVQAIAVHGRTKSQMYEGKSSNEYIRMVKEAVSIPVIGNGDIRTVSDAKRMLQETSCDAIMIGRGLLGKPFFLKELKSALNNEEYIEPTFEERIELAKAYAQELCAYEGEYVGMRMMRSMASWYIAGMPYSAEFKNKLSYIETYDDMNHILEAYKEKLEETDE